MIKVEICIRKALLLYGQAELHVRRAQPITSVKAPTAKT